MVFQLSLVEETGTFSLLFSSPIFSLDFENMDSDSLPDLSSILSDQDFLDLLDSRDLFANTTGAEAQNNIFNSGNDALMYLLSNGVDSPGTTLLASSETPKTPNVQEERLLHTPDGPTNTPYSPTDTPYSPTPIRPPAPSYSSTPDLKVESEYDPFCPNSVLSPLHLFAVPVRM